MTTSNNEPAYILDEIAYKPNLSALKKQLRIREGSSLEADLVALVEEAKAIARPKAMYRLVFVDEKRHDEVIIDGITLHSRILRVNLDTAQRAFVYIATCGRELQAWGEQQTDIVAQFWADTIKQDALGPAMGALNAHLKTCYKLGKTSAMSPGRLANWPIREQRPLFSLLGDPETAIGVHLTESFLMIPNKSVSGIRYPTEESFESCQLCPREGCPNRKAAYEPELYRQRYQV